MYTLNTISCSFLLDICVCVAVFPLRSNGTGYIVMGTQMFLDELLIFNRSAQVFQSKI